MLIDGSFLYASNDNALIKVNLNDFSVTTIASGENVQGLTVAGDAVYWGAYDPSGSTPTFTIKKARKCA
jgi:hypothetical protein